MNPDAASSPPWRRLLRRPYLLVPAALLLLALLWTVARSGGSKVDSTEYYEVRRDDFLISIVEGGNILAVDELIVRNEVEGIARIIYIVPEGSFVKKGDLLVQLDSATAEDQVNLQLITVEKAQFSVVQAQEQLAIQQSQSASDIRVAEIKLELARIDLRKFLEGEVYQKRREYEVQVETVKEKLAVDQDTLKWTEDLHREGFETKANLDKHKLVVSGTQLSLQQATNTLWMWENFEYTRFLTDYKSKVEEAEKELDRIKHQAKSKLAQFQADLRTQEATLDLQQKKLERDRKNLANARILAPADGLVVYASGENRFSSESLIEEGATVRNRQELIKLPDTSQMKLSIKIHETHVAKVRPGLPAYVVLDSLPDQRFQGTVSRVALLPDSQSRWGNPNLKVYNTEILITDKLPDTIKPGVSARAEIIITNLDDVIKAPVQAVTSLKGKPVVYLAEDPPRSVPVEVGLFNTKFIEITSGLHEGDRILLSPPLDAQATDLAGGIVQAGEAVPTNAPPPLRPNANPNGNGIGAASPDNPSAPQTAGPPAGGEEGQGRRGNRPGFNREEMLKQFDKNGDGQLDDDERAAMRQAFPRRRPEGEGGPGGGPGGGQGGGQGGRPAPGGGSGPRENAGGGPPRTQ